ncbi:hypothetical protein COCVIDRAFT_112805 [Bipolaris victoriae FI3]|uniref:BZIP domain-containing protein n=1 Tax=Bipolaris victoriae (strain FI3) TaxID=930091 RepID=W7E7J1_BIPV3|nr:hypothetical protein COCVIDRAFT_112805 [Bipolaris victoriae FI3]
MKLTAAQLVQRRKKNRESQRKSRQRVKNQINTLERQNKELESNNVSLRERLLHTSAAIEVLEKGANLH